MNGIPEKQKYESVQNVNQLIGISQKCTSCHQIKTLDCFSLDKRRKYKRRSKCKICSGCDYKIYREKNITSIRLRNRKYSKIYRKNNFATTSAQSKKWLHENPEKVKIFRRNFYDRTKNIPKYRLNRAFGNLMRLSIKSTKTGRHWEDLVDYTIFELKEYVEKRFKKGMSWDNYGIFWEIDHIIPVAVFNFEKPEDIDFKKCWNLNNLRPLEVCKNRSKQAIIYEPFQPSLTI